MYEGNTGKCECTFEYISKYLLHFPSVCQCMQVRHCALAAAGGGLRADEGHWQQQQQCRLGGRLEGRRGHANTQMNGGEEGLSSE